MIRAVFICLLVLLRPVWAQDLPALYAVTGVASNDVLNIRQAPDPASDILGTLAPDATGVEVMEIRDGWAKVNSDEMAGFVAARYLRPMSATPWHQLEQPLFCGGTEPFWSFVIDPAAGAATFHTPDLDQPQTLPLSERWRGESWNPSAAVAFDQGLAVVRRETCSDGMSERSYGLQIDIFLNGSDGQRLSGCCMLAAN